MSDVPAPVDVLGVPLHPVSRAGSVAAIVAAVAAYDGVPFTHVAINANKLLACADDPGLADSVRDADLCTADGVGAILMARRLGHAVPERVTGIDLMDDLVAEAALRGWPVFLLGAEPGVAQAAADRLVALHPGLIVAGVEHGFFPAGSEPEVADRIAASGARLLFVALPTPRKERFVDVFAKRSGVAFAMGVGGAFDVLAGRLARAPGPVQRVGLEWAWRWAQEPRRLASRYGLGGVRFLKALVLGRQPE